MKNGENRALGKRLVAKFVLVLSVSLIVTFGLFVVAAYYTGTGILDRFDEHQSAEITEILEEQIRTTMLVRNPEHLRSIIDGTLNASSISSAILFKSDGSIIQMSSVQDSTSIPYDLIIESLDSAALSSFTHLADGEEFSYASVPIDRLPSCTECHGRGSGPIGYLTVGTRAHSFAEITQGHRNSNIILTAVVFLVLAVVISTTVLLIVVRPLKRFTRELDDRVDSIRMDHHGHELDPVKYLAGDSTEIMHMVERFNELSAQLNSARHEIEDSHRKELESVQNLGYIGEMAAHTAHEIKNPLAGIRGSLQTIASKMPEESPHRDILRRAVRELERIYQSIMDLLTTAKGKAPEFRMLQVNTVLNDIVRVAEGAKRTKQVSFSLALDPSLPPIEADRNIASQIVWNLLTNAIDAVPSGGTITVSTRRADGDNDSISIVIEDNGPGIPEEDHKNIFNPFVSGKDHGTGLGLSVVRTSVETHDGTISLKSTVGEGAVFTVTLPVKHGQDTRKDRDA